MHPIGIFVILILLFMNLFHDYKLKLVCFFVCFSPKLHRFFKKILSFHEVVCRKNAKEKGCLTEAIVLEHRTECHG